MQQVVSYWNSVDETLELDLDVLDDLTGEAAEVCAALRNPWLSYGAHLHRLREFGSCNKLLDLLDEKRLSAAEMKNLVELIIGAAASDLPHPDIDWQSFQDAIKTVLSKVPKVYDPVHQRLQDWVSIGQLRRIYATKSRGPGCAVM